MSGDYRKAINHVIHCIAKAVLPLHAKLLHRHLIVRAKVTLVHTSNFSKLMAYRTFWDATQSSNLGVIYSTILANMDPVCFSQQNNYKMVNLEVLMHEHQRWWKKFQNILIR